MSKKTNPAFTLSQEELFVVLAYLKVDALVGLDNQILKSLSPEQIQLVMSVAERALISREFLSPDADNRLQLEKVVLAIVGACAAAETTLVVTHNRPNRPTENLFFHTARKMVVMHSMPVTAIHQFVALEEKSDIAKLVTAILNVKEQSILKCPEGQIQDELITQARDAALESGKAKALEVLAKSKLEQSTAGQFATTLTSLVSNTTQVYIKHQKNGDSAADGFTILQGSNGAWILKPIENDKTAEKYVSLKPTSPKEISEKTRSLISAN